MATTVRGKRQAAVVSDAAQQKIEGCKVVVISDEMYDKANGKQYGLVRCRLPKSYNEIEVLACQTGKITVQEGDEVNLFHSTYIDKNGMKRHHFDIQEITGLATSEELDKLFK